MKISCELKQGYIDVWNEENEEWDRYIKIEKKSVVEEEKKIPEKLENLYKIEKGLTLDGVIAWQGANNKILGNKIDEIIDYLNSKGNE